MRHQKREGRILQRSLEYPNCQARNLTEVLFQINLESQTTMKGETTRWSITLNFSLLTQIIQRSTNLISRQRKARARAKPRRKKDQPSESRKTAARTQGRSICLNNSRRWTCITALESQSTQRSWPHTTHKLLCKIRTWSPTSRTVHHTIQLLWTTIDMKSSWPCTSMLLQSILSTTLIQTIKIISWRKKNN